MKKILGLCKRYLLHIIGAIIGGVGGYAYWYFIGCSSGTCPITSSPLNSTLWGLVMGILLFSSFSKKEIK